MAARLRPRRRRPDLVETVEGFEKPQITAESAPVTNLKLTSGRFECVLTTGRAAFVKAGGEVVGIFFSGGGTMEYVSAEPIEMPVVAYVSKKSSGMKVEKSDKEIRLKDKFTDLLWLSAGAPLPELPGMAPMPLTAGFQAHEAVFHERRGSPRSFGFAMQRFDAPSAPYVWVELDGGSDPAVYVRDGMLNPSESLTVLRSRNTNEKELKDALFPVRLSSPADRLGRQGAAQAPVRSRGRGHGGGGVRRQGRQGHGRRDARAPEGSGERLSLRPRLDRLHDLRRAPDARVPSTCAR